VAFGQTRAAIMTDTYTKIVTKVSVIATTGHISVTAAAGTAISREVFTVTSGVA
jgi:hypothetical protein